MATPPRTRHYPQQPLQPGHDRAPAAGACVTAGYLKPPNRAITSALTSAGAVSGDVPGVPVPADVVDQYVDPGQPPEYLASQPPHPRLVRDENVPPGRRRPCGSRGPHPRCARGPGRGCSRAWWPVPGGGWAAACQIRAASRTIAAQYSSRYLLARGIAQKRRRVCVGRQPKVVVLPEPGV